MAPRKPKPSLVERTPIAEWTAAALGLVLTLVIVGYTVWEGVTADPGPPRLSVVAQEVQPTSSGFVVPIVVRNASHATAAQVEVVAALGPPGSPTEERRAQFAYVPGRGEARGGLVFQADPASGPLRLVVESYADP